MVPGVTSLAAVFTGRLSLLDDPDGTFSQLKKSKGVKGLDWLSELMMVSHMMA